MNYVVFNFVNTFCMCAIERKYQCAKNNKKITHRAHDGHKKIAKY